MNPNGQGAPNNFPQGNNFGPNNLNQNPYPNNYGPQPQFGPNPMQQQTPAFEPNPAPQMPAPQPNPVQQAPSFNAPVNNQYFQASRDQQAQDMLNQVIQSTNMPKQQEEPAPAPAPKKKGHALEIVLIIFIFIVAIVAIVGAAYCYNQYKTLSDGVNSSRSEQISKVKSAQKQIDDKNYEIRSASNLKEFTGPTDFGAITFNYPKTWNIYLDNNDDSNPTYRAYFSPSFVPPTSGYNFALRFSIENRDYTSYMKQFEQKKLASTSAFSINGLTGSKVMGKLDEKEDQPNGAEVILQVNNYVAVIRTDDYDTYGTEFDAILADLKSANY